MSNEAGATKEELEKLERKNYEVQQEILDVLKEKVNHEECISILKTKCDEAENILKVLQQNNADMDLKMNEKKLLLRSYIRRKNNL